MKEIVVKVLFKSGDMKTERITPSPNLELPSHPDDIYHKEGNVKAIGSAIPHIDENGDIWKMLTVTTLSENL